MQSLHDFRELRMRLRGALIARDTMRNRGIPQPRRDLATEAYSRALDQILPLLERLETQLLITGSGAKPTFEVIEEMLASIDRSERLLGGTV